MNNCINGKSTIIIDEKLQLIQKHVTVTKIILIIKAQGGSSVFLVHPYTEL